MTGAGSDELVDICDEAGNIVGTATRGQMRAEGLPHRATYVVLVRGPSLPEGAKAGELSVNRSDRVVVHQRADWKDVYPSYWDLAFGGVCAAGEQWDESARRELVEEAGVDENLVLLAESEYTDDGNHLFGRIYLARSEADLRCDDGEVVAVDEVAIGDLADWCAERPVCPDSVELALAAVLALID